jgi:hypothetical protein
MKTFLAPLPGSGIWLSLILLLALSSRAGGQTVAYDNGAPNQVNGSEMTSFIEADEFAVANLATIGSVRFWDFEMATAFAGSMYWSLNTNNAGLPGTQLFGGVGFWIPRIFQQLFNPDRHAPSRHLLAGTSQRTTLEHGFAAQPVLGDDQRHHGHRHRVRV